MAAQAGGLRHSRFECGVMMRKPNRATERLIVPISSADKRVVEKKASAGKMSMAEFVRRAALRYDPRTERRREEVELCSLLEAFHATHAETIAQLDRTDAALDAALAHFATKENRSSSGSRRRERSRRSLPSWSSASTGG